MEICISTLLENLKRRGFAVTRVSTPEEARDYLLRAIGEKETVGIGGSMTIEELSLLPELRRRGNPVFWHWHRENQTPAQAHRGASEADVYLCSANAITADGRIVNIDGTGNRLAALAWGPGRVILVVGKNKVSGTLDEAVERIKTKACPPNARRLGLNTPCAKLGYCTDCDSPQRICKATLILDRAPNSHPVEVVLVERDMGY